MNNNEFRIIAGQWRGRKLSFPPLEGLRPTTNRIRETLFNWLAPYIIDSTCLDAFAGSGALGIEALSRGAKQVTFIEIVYSAIDQLKKNLVLLKNPPSVVETGDFLKTSMTHRFDIIFLDPPFHKDLLAPALDRAKKLLNPEGLLYVECEKDFDLLSLATDLNLTILKNKTAGQVRYALLNVIYS